MTRTYRYDNGLNKGRDDKPFDSRCAPDTHYTTGYNTFDDDHGHYGAGGHRVMKKAASAARRVYEKELIAQELEMLESDEPA